MDGIASNFASMFDERSRAWDWHALLNFKNIAPPVRQHLRKVYTTLAGTLAVAALGVFLHMQFNLGGVLSTIAFIGCTFWLLATPDIPSQENKRLTLLGGAALAEGLTVGPLVDLAFEVDPSIVLSAFLATSVTFVCFSAAALYAPRREFLFLGGIISSAVSSLILLNWVSFVFGGAAVMMQLELYLGLLIFLGYVLFDTQMIVERASVGKKDYVRDTLEFFMDFMAIFVRLLVILLRKESENKKRSKNDRRSNTRRR